MGVVTRAVAAILLALGLAAVPVERAAACDCALIELPEALAEADVAFVGTLVDHAPGGDNFGFSPLDEWHWSIERSRDAGLEAFATVRAAVNDGANCGVSFGMDERWLVLASVHDGVLQTNGCTPHRRVDGGANAETEAVVNLFVEVGQPTAASAPSVPGPLLVAIVPRASSGSSASWPSAGMGAPARRMPRRRTRGRAPRPPPG